MPQICPSPSHQLAAAVLAFHRARRKFPKNLGSCACSRDITRTTLQVAKDEVLGISNIISNQKPDYNPKMGFSFCSNPRGNCVSYPSLPSSRTASWSNDCHRNLRGRINSGLKAVTRPEVVCLSCNKKQSCNQANKQDQEQRKKVESALDSPETSTAMFKRACSKIKPAESRESNQSHGETASKSTHSSAGSKKRKHARHRRPCIQACRIRRCVSRSPLPDTSQICRLHGYSAGTRRRSLIPEEPQSVKYYNGRVSTVGKEKSRELPDKVYSSDSPTAVDFPTKLQTWKYRTRQECYRREDMSHRASDYQKTYPKQQSLNLLTNRQALGKSHSHQNETSTEKPQEFDSSTDVCLRPSLIKAAQRKGDLEIRGESKSYRSDRVSGRLSKHLDSKSTWEENLNVINHKDSMSLLMERFREKKKHHSRKLQNIHELNSVLGSQTSCAEGEPLQLRTKQHAMDDADSIGINYPRRKSSSGVNPVTKLGIVANQAIRGNENQLKSLRSRLNRSGICYSSKEMPRRRAF